MDYPFDEEASPLPPALVEARVLECVSQCQANGIIMPSSFLARLLAGTSAQPALTKAIPAAGR